MADRGTTGRLLIVEDEPDVTELLRYNLTKEEYDILAVPTGADAVRPRATPRPT